MTQTGSYTQGSTKINQDYSVTVNDLFLAMFPQRENFPVYQLFLMSDGHGTNGHLVSTFIVEKYPMILAERLLKVLDDLEYSADQSGERNLDADKSEDESVEEDDEEGCSPRMKGRKLRVSANAKVPEDRWQQIKRKRASIKQALAESFPQIHTLICSQWFDTQHSGATLTACLLTDDGMLYTANVGDS